MANEVNKVMVIGAHPDDYEISAGMSICRFKGEGKYIVGLVCSYGERGGADRRTRRNETETAAKILGIDELHFLEHEDTRISRGTFDLFSKIPWDLTRS